MYNKTTSHLGLMLPHEQNDLEDDVLRIIAAFKAVDAFAQATDATLAARLAQATSADDLIAGLLLRATATEQAQGLLEAVQTGHGQTLLAHAAALALKLEGPPTAERPGGIRVGAGLELTTGENGETDVLAVSLDELGGHLLLNSEEWITESGSWIAPVTGWYDILLFDGGGSGASNRGNVSQCSGGYAGRWVHVIKYFTAMQEILVTIGAGGVPIVTSTGYNSGAGGSTSFGDINTATTVFNGFSANTGLQIPQQSGFFAFYGTGAGFGGGNSIYTNIDLYASQDAMNAAGNATGYFGGGGGSGLTANGLAAGKGAPGSVRVRWHDPDKAAGPLPEPALFSARRMASRAADSPATVNLYDPETGQGSVWREEDAPAQLTKGMITEEAWQEICAAKAAEDYAAWLADPETEAERFELLRMACEAKLTATDKLTTADYPISDEDRAAANAYRKAIRELNHQPGAPWDGGGELTPWPEMPVITKVTE